MGGARVAIDTAVFAAPVGIDACIEANVRAVVGGYDGSGCVLQKLGVRCGVLRVGLTLIRHKPEGLEAVSWIFAGTATVDWGLLSFHSVIPVESSPNLRIGGMECQGFFGMLVEGYYCLMGGWKPRGDYNKFKKFFRVDLKNG